MSSCLPVMRGTSTSHQRLYMRTLLRDLELPTDYITAQHRDLFTAAHLPEPRHGRGVDEVLTELSKAQASTLIEALRSRTRREP